MKKNTEYYFKVVIPARKNSKRFPNKNLATLRGITLLEHTLKFALQIFLNTDIWVNSDDQKILNIAKIYNVNTYYRDSELAGDCTSTGEVLKDQVEFFMQQNIKIDAIILLQITSPLRPNYLIVNALDIFKVKNLNSLAFFAPLNCKYGKINNNTYTPSNYKFGQRMQDIVPEYYETGQLYITKVDKILMGEVLTKDVYPIVVDDISATIDIDEPKDLEWAEFVLERYMS